MKIDFHVKEGYGLSTLSRFFKRNSTEVYYSTNHHVGKSYFVISLAQKREHYLLFVRVNRIWAQM